mmetsp:Transcript_3097/g.5442  ORF Transcript_3097/g.5442 Transcript_3097/m.5442 type:complete len:1092 (-) Transcript_3097:55-3330(-)
MAAEEAPDEPVDDPWAEPVVEEVPEDPVDFIEITYTDPKTGEECKRNVFCEPEDWRERYISRLLVSTDLVNSLTEAQVTWHGRWDAVHFRLENSRVAYYNELSTIRAFIKRLYEYNKSQEEPEEGDSDLLSPFKAKEVCPVHFFLPECYLDDWTIERRDKAIETFKEEVTKEIKVITEKINLLGGGTWRQLLAYFIRKGHSPTHIVEELMRQVTDPEERRHIENTITDGLRGKYEELDEIIKVLQVEDADMRRRWLDVSNQEQKCDFNIQWQRDELKKMLDFLAEPEPEEPPVDPSLLEGATKKIFEELQEKLDAADEEVKRLRKELEELLANAPDDEETKKLEQEAKAAERKRRVINMRVERIDEKTAESNARVSAIQAKIDKERETIAELQEKLARLPPPTDESLALKRIQREIHNLRVSDKKIQAAMIKPTARIKAMRAQLRDLYKKLGWEWDLSDSEDEDEEEKPYWKRRQIAVDGFLPFDPRMFVYDEKAYKDNRHKKRTERGFTHQETKLLSQLSAKNLHHGDTRDEFGEEIKPSDEAGTMMFGPSAGPMMFGASAKDSVEEAISSARGLLSVSRASRRPPTHAQRMQEERWNAQLLQLRQLRQSFEVQLRQCVECFVDLLPPDGTLGDLRLQLQDMLVRFFDSPSDPADFVECGTDIPIERACELLQSTIQEVIIWGDHVHPISAAMLHSVSFAELSKRLSQVLQTERDIRESLKASQQTKSRVLVAASDESVASMQRASAEAAEASTLKAEKSSPSSPVPFGSKGSLKGPRDARSVGVDRSTSPEEAGLAGPLSVGSRNSPSPPPGALKLPPRLMATADSLLGTKSRSQKHRRGPQVDFGFRPNGSAEESLETWSLFKASTSVAERLTRLLQTEQDAEVLVKSLQELGQMGQAARPFAPVVAKLLHAREAAVRQAAAEALEGMQGTGNAEYADQQLGTLKVQKAGARRSETTSTGFGLTAGTSFLSEKSKRTDSKMQKHRSSAACDFHEYMSQAQSRSTDTWMSQSITASTPSLNSSAYSDKKKLCPSLPQLIRAKEGRGLGGLGRAQSSVGFATKDIQHGSWSRGTKRIDEYTRMFGMGNTQ